MINAFVIELNAASDVTYRKNGDSEFGTLLGIQNVYQGDKPSTKLPLPILLQENCVGYAQTVGLAKGRRFVAHGKLTYSEQHKSYTLKADQISIFPLSKSKTAGSDDNPDEKPNTGVGLESKPKKTKLNPK